MKTLNASFKDLHGRIVNVETEENLLYKIKFAKRCVYEYEINNNNTPKIIADNLKTYWQHRLDCLELIKKLNIKTLFQHWQAGNIGGFGSFQTAIFKAYQIADSGNTEKLNAAFPEWFVNSYQL